MKWFGYSDYRRTSFVYSCILLFAAVEQRANTSLNRVQELKDSSKVVEEEAKKLQSGLKNTQQLSNEALDISTTALQAIRKEDEVHTVAGPCRNFSEGGGDD